MKLKLGSRENKKSRLGLRTDGGVPAGLAERKAARERERCAGSSWGGIAAQGGNY